MPTIPHLNKRCSKALALSAITTATLLALPAHAIDVDAGDYTALPAGTSLGLVYYQHATRDKLYAGGNQVAINPKLTSDIGIVRGVHFMEIGGYIVDPQFLLPFGKLSAKNDIAALGSNSGVGDLLLAATVWLTKPGDKTHFGITPFISAPTGQYDRNDPLSLGENRWKYALQAGFITPLADKVMLDLAADVQIHGKNKDFGASSATMEQKHCSRPRPSCATSSRPRPTCARVSPTPRVVRPRSTVFGRTTAWPPPNTSSVWRIS